MRPRRVVDGQVFVERLGFLSVLVDLIAREFAARAVEAVLR